MLQESPPRIEGADFAGQLFFRLWRASHTQTAAALGSVGLSPARFAVLNYIGNRDAAIQLEIGSAMRIDPSTMVSLVDELERAGLAQRRPRPEDRRAREVLITPKGRRTLERARDLAKQVEDDILQALSPADRRRLIALLRQALQGAPQQPPWTAEEGN